MGDSSWMRLLPGQRCRTPVSPWLHNGQTDNEDAHEAANLRITPRPLAGFNQSSAEFANDILVKEADRLRNTPSVDEMADMLRTTIMVSPTPPVLDPQYTSYVLHLIEGYSKLRNKLSAKEKEVAQLKAKQQEDRENNKILFTDWTAQEARYKAEIKRLELIIQQVSGKGVEAVALARSGSLIRKAGAGRAHIAEAAASEQVPAEEEFCQDECKNASPYKGTDTQSRRISISSDTLDLTARLSIKRQLWRHRSENNLLEPSRRVRIGQREHCHGQPLSHLASSHLHLTMETPEPEPKEECNSDDEQRLDESDAGNSE